MLVSPFLFFLGILGVIVDEKKEVSSRALYGRKTIYSNEIITPENVINVINRALAVHIQNVADEDYLYWYRRGVMPILSRKKERNTIVNNKIVENHADEICSFKNGYFLTQPAFYISRNDEAQGDVSELNEYLFRSGKQQADNDVVDWFHTVGRAAIFIHPVDDDECPAEVFALDPRSAFVIYSLAPGNKPLAGVNVVIADGNNKLKIDVYTEDKIYRITGTTTGELVVPGELKNSYLCSAVSVDSIENNLLGAIPIVEYQYNSIGMSAFENVVGLLDCMNLLQSNRIDGIEQFIQSIAIAVNCQFEDDVTADKIREAGMLCLHSTGDNKADFRILSEQLDQTQAQLLCDYLYQQILTICAMPSTTKGGSSTSDTGAAVMARDGWFQADASARNCEDLFRKSNKRFDKIFLEILHRRGLCKELKLKDFELHFVRNETANIQSKAQAFQTMLASGLHPELAAAKSGISNDAVSDMKMSAKYLEMIWGNPNEPKESATPKVEIVDKSEDITDDNAEIV